LVGQKNKITSLVARVDQVVSDLLDDVRSSTRLLGLIVDTNEDGFVGFDGDAASASLLSVHAPVVGLQGEVLHASQVDTVSTNVGGVLVSSEESLDLVGLYSEA